MFGIFKKKITKKYKNGDIYIGEMKNNKRHGQGTVTYTDGAKYVGKWKDDKRCGQGTNTWTSGDFAGDKYVGEWKNDEFNGHGTYIWSDGDKYVGEWKDHSKHGHGIITSNDGNKYVGEFIDNEFNGHGTYTCSDGSKYDGDWEDGEQCGKGTFTSADGEVEEGVWEKETVEKKDGFDFLRHKKKEEVSDGLSKLPVGLRIAFFDDIFAFKSVEWITNKYKNRIREKAIEAAKEKLKYQKKKASDLPEDQLEHWVMDAEKKIKSKDKWTLVKILMLPAGVSFLPWL